MQVAQRVRTGGDPALRASDRARRQEPRPVLEPGHRVHAREAVAQGTACCLAGARATERSRQTGYKQRKLRKAQIWYFGALLNTVVHGMRGGFEGCGSKGASCLGKPPVAFLTVLSVVCRKR